MLIIRKAGPTDADAVWEIFHEVVSPGDTYAYAPETVPDEAVEIWMNRPAACYVAETDGRIQGTYFIKANQPGLGDHVCNCGYMVTAGARGKGIASAMCAHSQQEARRLGFLGMQFNLVVSTNTGAVRLWQKLGFSIVGTLEKAFRHRDLGLVDAYVMYRWLGER